MNTREALEELRAWADNNLPRVYATRTTGKIDATLAALPKEKPAADTELDAALCNANNELANHGEPLFDTAALLALMVTRIRALESRK